MTVAIALGGGAPNLTLMTGALYALDEAGVDYKVITTTGAGMVAGLLYSAPRRISETETWQEARKRSLLSTREMGIDDLIYNQLPVNYKIFQKPGKMAEAYAHVVNPTIWGIPRKSRRQRLLGDAMGLMAAMMQPTSLSTTSQGLCQPPPWISLMVDFDELESNLEEGDKAFALSAYCIEEKREHTFRKKDLSEEHFKAGLAMPFLYAPYKLKNDKGEIRTYLEGSAIRTMQFNPDDVMKNKDVDTLIYFDLMGNRHLLAEPKNLVDAWGKSIVAPLTQLAYLQEQLVDLKRFAYSVMGSNTEIIANYDEMTGKIEAAVKGLDVKDNPELKRLVAQIKKNIKTARLGRAKLLDETEERLTRMGKSFIGNDPSQPESQTVAQNPADDDPWDEFLSTSDGSEEENQEILRQKNLLRYAGFTINELEKISNSGGETIHIDKPKMLRMPFRNHMPEEQWEKVLDWSHSNMSTLFDIGYDTAHAFVQRHWKDLDLDQAPPAVPSKYKALNNIEAAIEAAE